MRATLVLEDGTIQTGIACGARADAVFEMVFHTSMTGYQEILTDPSYRGQGVVFTQPHIGNVGINPDDHESGRAQVAAMIVRSLSPCVSNWRSRRDLDSWLSEQGVPGITGVDTRRLTRGLREQGTMKAALSTTGTDPVELLRECRAWAGLDGIDMVRWVTCDAPYAFPAGLRGTDGTAISVSEPAGSAPVSDQGALSWVQRAREAFGDGDHLEAPLDAHVVVLDFGVKRTILRHLALRAQRVTVVPAATSSSEVLALRPDGIVLSNGPGDPAALDQATATVRELLETGVPLLGICLGHQLIGRALGGITRRLPFGHHGGNHPVRDARSGEVLITSHNHNYCVDPASLDVPALRVTHESLNDGSLEGLELLDRPVLSVQFHPEAGPGPHDAHDVFTRFFKMVADRIEHPKVERGEGPRDPVELDPAMGVEPVRVGDRPAGPRDTGARRAAGSGSERPGSERPRSERPRSARLGSD